MTLDNLKVSEATGFGRATIALDNPKTIREGGVAASDNPETRNVGGREAVADVLIISNCILMTRGDQRAMSHARSMFESHATSTLYRHDLWPSGYLRPDLHSTFTFGLQVI